MNILAFEAAQFSLSLALMVNKHIVAQDSCHDIYQQDAYIIPAIQNLLHQHQLSLTQLDYIVTTRGPGSFTGLRMTLATATALSLATSVPAVGLSLFDVLYRHIQPNIEYQQACLLILESKRTEFYCQFYRDREIPHSFMADINGIVEFVNTHHIPITFTNSARCALLMPSCKFISLNAGDLCNYILSKAPLNQLDHYPCTPLYHRQADALASSK